MMSIIHMRVLYNIFPIIANLHLFICMYYIINHYHPIVIVSVNFGMVTCKSRLNHSYSTVRTILSLTKCSRQILSRNKISQVMEITCHRIYSLCTTDYTENTPNSIEFASYLSLHTVTSSTAYNTSYFYD